MQLIGKLIITGQIEALTGLHIGGSKTSMDIGEVDLNVIKTPRGVPFVPGSSLKGKLRSLLAKIEGKLEVRDDNRYIKEIFGSAADTKETDIVTRLIVRDAPLNTNHFQDTFDGAEMDFEYSDIKFENRIDRRTGTAKDPRQLERVPAGAKFDCELVYDMYNDCTQKIEGDTLTRLDRHLGAIYRAMQLLQDDYLGGQGSRGYGKIRFLNMSVKLKKISPEHGYAVATPDENITAFAQKISGLHTEALNFDFE